MKTEKITRLALLLALGLILSYLESLLPVMYFVPPGVKLGLSNLVTMFVLYQFGGKDALLILSLRVVLSGFMFSGLTSIIFGMAGGALCVIVMSLLKRIGIFSVMGVSMAGAVCHNLGQLIAACFVVSNANMLYYLPILCAAGLISGIVTGYISALLINRLGHFFR